MLEYRCMIYTEQSELGVISINKSAITQIVTEAFKPWIGKVKISNAKKFSLGKNGLYFELAFGVQIGESISDISNKAMDFIADAFINSLEFEIDDIVLIVSFVYTQKGTQSPRNIVYRYSERKES